MKPETTTRPNKRFNPFSRLIYKRKKTTKSATSLEKGSSFVSYGQKLKIGKINPYPVIKNMQSEGTSSS